MTTSDANWKDKLTSYDGKTITYDAIGNPLSYRDGMKMNVAKRQAADCFTKGDNCCILYL